MGSEIVEICATSDQQIRGLENLIQALTFLYFVCLLELIVLFFVSYDAFLYCADSTDSPLWEDISLPPKA